MKKMNGYLPKEVLGSPKISRWGYK
jgi:hypothetical protein